MVYRCSKCHRVVIEAIIFVATCECDAPAEGFIVDMKKGTPANGIISDKVLKEIRKNGHD